MPGLQKYVSDFQIDLALMSIIGALVGTRRTGYTKDSALVTICPECEAPTKVNQQYACGSGHGPFKAGECDKAREVTKGTLVRVDADAVKEATASQLQPNVLELSVHRLDEVDAQTFPGENAYVFYPKNPSKQYALLHEVVQNPELAFIGMCNIRNSEKLLRVRAWGENLVVQALMFPEELNQRDTVTAPELDDKYRQMSSLFAKMVEDFEPTAYRNTKREKILALTETAGMLAHEPSGVTKVSEDSALDALLAQLSEKSA